ncbi:membrane protein implicated in regulation of membrane protease activity [Dyadobacter jejuensis]|uniref:Membrane protein implicated in regulation of membrane protease activity n=1 Tax=Dyadobacter jejuensis TaxID=1082580 RepID=A0A316BDF9_9BACT|nr:NfeD family protein [Dyadobacter jejuensis]PWJ60527.1 membrane protein implicated in regulation of membrane protease activity [Dyadobacter jejuensis]
MIDLSLPQIWLIVGLIMLVLELISVVLVFVFFSIGALLTALLAILGILPGIEIQIVAFSVISLSSMLLLRKHARRLLGGKGKQHEYSEFVGETAMVIKDIDGGKEGKIYYRGAEWIALSSNKTPISAGSKVKIIEARGIVLIVVES